MSGDGSFSERHGYSGEEVPIVVRHDAPSELRHALLALARRAGMAPGLLVDVLANTLLKAPQGNWSPDVLLREAKELIEEAPWFRVYDVAEAIYEHLPRPQWSYTPSPEQVRFERGLNEYFKENGIGWQMVRGRLEVRAAEAFEETIRHATDAIAQSGRTTAASELREALADLSRRPAPDITGAVQHATAAVECAARDISGDQKATLGKLVADHPEWFPKPLDDVVKKFYGFASEYGRHVREGRSPKMSHALQVVGFAATITSALVEAEKEQRC